MPTTWLMSAARLDFRMEDSCPPQARRSVTAVYTGTMGPQNLSICPIRDSKSDLGAVSVAFHGEQQIYEDIQDKTNKKKNNSRTCPSTLGNVVLTDT